MGRREMQPLPELAGTRPRVLEPFIREVRLPLHRERERQGLR